MTDRKYHRSTAHQALRDLLASMVSEIKRDRRRMNETDVAFDLGYMSALTYAIKVDVDNSMNFGRVHDVLKSDCKQATRVLEKVS